MMTLFDPPESPSFVTITATAFVRTYHECVERFLRSIGVNEQNANEFKMCTQHVEPMSGEIFHHGTKVAEISTRFEIENGYRFVVECKVRQGE